MLLFHETKLRLPRRRSALLFTSGTIAPRPNLPDGFFFELPWAGTDRQTDTSEGELGLLRGAELPFPGAGGVLRENAQENSPCCSFKSFPFILKSSHLA